ncbi:OmpA family protein [soil metagenome]
MKKLLFSILGVLLLSFAQAQNIPFEKEYFRDREPDFKEAMQYLTKGRQLFDEGESAFRLALPYLERAYSFNKNNAELNLDIGYCLLKTSRQYDALRFFNDAKNLDRNVDPRIDYLIAFGEQLNSNWDNAIYDYKDHLLRQACKDPSEKAKTLQRIKECEYGKLLSAKPSDVEILNLGNKINSVNGDYIPLISADGKKMFFTSRRAETTGGEIDDYDGEFLEDVYYCNKETNGWGSPQNIGAPVNSKFHDAAVGLSVDGHQLIIFRGYIGNGDLFISSNNGFNWSEPESLGKEINSSSHESSACFSPDGNTLYFVSDRAGGFGGRDIWKSIRSNEKSEWGKPVNLGNTINTIEDEEGVFMHPDGRTLYFSSKGHDVIGGFDIFYANLDQGIWSTPVNMGVPINTPGDDVSFEVSTDGREAYYSSYRKEGYGEKDLYKIEFTARKEPVSKMVLLQGKVTNAETGLPLPASIEVIDLNLNQQIGKYSNDAQTGSYVISLPSGKNYGTVIYSNGYLFESENYDLSDSSAYKEVERNVKLKVIKAGNEITLQNIFFETASFNLKETSVNELNRLVELMKQYPTLKIEIAGHTDNVGSDAYNLELSQKRANAVKDFLLDKAIESERLLPIGYGMNKPKVSNDTTEGRQKNRRIELMVIAK